MGSRLKQQIWEWRGVLIAVPTATAIVFALRLMGLLQSFEWIAYDRFLRWRPLEPDDQRIVIVGINETDVRQLVQWPTSDANLAKLLDKVRQQKPRVIGLDLAREFSVEPGHRELLQVFQTTPNLIGVEKKPNFSPTQSQEDRNSAIAPPPALKALGQVAAANVVEDADGKLRRGLLALKTADQEEILGLGFRVALDYLNAGDNVPHPEAANPKPFQANDGGYVRADDGGHQVLINFRLSPNGFRTVSMMDVLQDRIPRDLMRDRMVLIGVTAISLKDYFKAAPDGGLDNDRTQTAGVEIHAHVASQIVSAAMDGRHAIETWPNWLEYLWTVGWAIVGATLSWLWRNTKSHSQKDRKIKGIGVLIHPSTAFLRSASTLLLGGCLLGITYFAFIAGWWIPLVPPLLALFGSGLIVTSYIARSASEIRTYFSRYLTDEVVSRLLETPEGLNFSGERRKVTILMCDLRGFSSISERLPPEKVVDILNIFLGAMTDVITQYRGTIDEFIGDAILVIFGAPILRESDAQRAVACSVAMQLQMEEVNAKIERLDLPKIAMGIGLHTGEVVVGNIGSQSRAKYAVVGSHVNLTSRIESYTVGGQILMSEATLKDAGSDVEIYGQMQVEPKGVKEPITVYDVKGIQGKYKVFLSKGEEQLFTPKEPIPVAYTVLEDKHIGHNSFEGSFVRLSSTSAEVRSERFVAPFSNVRIKLLVDMDESDEGEAGEGFYAKVLEKEVKSDSTFYVRFTTVPPEVASWLQRIGNSGGNALHE